MLKFVVTVLGSAALWILFVAGTKQEEMLVGAICTLFTVAATGYVASRSSLRVRLRWIDIAQVWCLPWYLIFGIWEIVGVLVLDLLHIRAADSLFRAAPFVGHRRAAVATGRRVLAVTYTTATPNFIILGIDSKTHWMLFYQIRKSGIPWMTRRLGAQG